MATKDLLTVRLRSKPTVQGVVYRVPTVLLCRRSETLTELRAWWPPGFRCDIDGRIWSSMPDGICVLDPNTMEVVCQVIMGVNTANLVFGDGGDVFICGAGHVWRLQRKV